MTALDLAPRTARCANKLCGRPTSATDIYVLVTDGHVRCFCSIDCIFVGSIAHDDEILGLRPDRESVMMDAARRVQWSLARSRR